MASNRNFTNFRAVYDDLTGEVERSREQFLPDHLDNWFALLDETPGVREIVKDLERSVFLDFHTWFRNARHIVTPQPLTLASKPPTRPAQVTWPMDRTKRLGTQLSVFRELAKRRETAGNFGALFIAGSDEKQGAKDLVETVFLPMARDLRRRLEAELGDREDLTIPAADRTVSLDHNTAPYQEAIEALDRLERTLEQANDYPDTDDKEQRIAEVSATRRLLQSARVRVGAVVALLGSGITYFATHLAGSAIDKAASGVVDTITALLGSIF